MNEDFRFSVSQWYGVMRSEIEIPTDAEIKAVLDPSFTASPTSDRSALVAGYKQPSEQGVVEYTLIDAESDRWRGMELAVAAVDFCHRVKPKELRIEKIPGTELLRDAILLNAESRQIEMPPIRFLTYDVQRHAKNIRICRLQNLLTRPPALHIKRGKFVEMLLEEVETFVPCVGNRSRQLGLLDALALACFR